MKIQKKHREIGEISMTEKKRKNLERKALRKKKKKIMTACIFAGAVIIIAAAIVAGVIIYRHFSIDESDPVINNSNAIFSEESLENGENSLGGDMYVISAVEQIDISEAITEIKNRDENVGSYRLVKHTEGKDGYFELNYWIESDKGHYEYIFEGDDMGTELNGAYYRTMIDGLGTIVEYSSGEYYTSGEFFDKYYGKLSAMTLDSLLEGIFGAEFTEAGKNSSGDLVLKGDGVSICVKGGAHYDTYILDERGEKAIGYYLSYGHIYDMPNI